MILITGVAGYLGSSMAIKLHKEGYKVMGIDCKDIVIPNILTYNINMQNMNDLRRIFITNDVKTVIHFAAFKSVKESIENPQIYYMNNINILNNLLFCMKEYYCKELIFSSSATVYGNNVSPMHEHMAIGNSTNPYGTTKCICETIINDCCKYTNMKAIILRYFNPAGVIENGYMENAPCPAENLVPNIIHAIKSDFTLQIFGIDYDTIDGTCERDFIHVEDLVSGHIKAITFMNNNAGCHTFNLGTGIPCTVLNLIETFKSTLNVDIKYVLKERRVGDVQTNYCCTDKAKNVLQWTAEKTIKDICESYRNQI